MKILDRKSQRTRKLRPLQTQLAYSYPLGYEPQYLFLNRPPRGTDLNSMVRLVYSFYRLQNKSCNNVSVFFFYNF